MRHADHPAFLYIHYMDVHVPYDPPASYAGLFSAGLARTEVIWKNGPHPPDVSAGRWPPGP